MKINSIEPTNFIRKKILLLNDDIADTNDYVEVFVANDAGTTDLLVSSAILRVN